MPRPPLATPSDDAAAPRPESADSARRRIAGLFEQAGLPDCTAEARLLVMHAAGLSHSQLISHGGDPLSGRAITMLATLTERRINAEPLDHILGYREFYGRVFEISKDVLSPRQETEEVVSKALSLISAVKAPRVLDLGTGSGAIITTLLSETPGAIGIATDISQAALAIAQRNANAHGTETRTSFLSGDWLAPVDGKFDLIISNPPYIESAAMLTLSPEVRNFDPALALNGGEDGLAPYRIISRASAAHMRANGWLVLEIGYNQGKSVPALLEDAGFRNINMDLDIAGLPRIISAQAPI